LVSIYEKMVEYDIPAMIHVSTSCKPVFSHHGCALPECRHHGVHAVPDGRPVQGLPDAAFCHPAWRRRCALPLGAIPRLAQELKKPLLRIICSGTSISIPASITARIDLLTRVIPVENILFASEMIGAVRGIDPETGNYYDDTRRYIEGSALGPEDRFKVYEGNARRRWYPRLDQSAEEQGPLTPERKGENSMSTTRWAWSSATSSAS